MLHNSRINTINVMKSINMYIYENSSKRLYRIIYIKSKSFLCINIYINDKYSGSGYADSTLSYNFIWYILYQQSFI